MEKLTKEEDLFEKYYHRLRRELNNAYWHFIIYKQLDGARGKYHNELMQAPEFFSLSERSHFLDAILRVNRICDDDRESLNIFKLLNYANTNIKIFSDESFQRRKGNQGAFSSSFTLERPIIDREYISQQLKRYSAFKKTNLKKLRNRVLAHIDRDDVANDLWPYKEYQVEAEKLEMLINEIDNTLNIFGMAFDYSRYDKEFSQIAEGITNMLELIRRGIQ